MNLEGTLQERPLTSVLQILGSRSSSGRLTVTRGQSGHERLAILFRNGLIVGTESRLRRPDLRIGELIRRGEYVPEAEIGQAIARAESGGGHVGDILVAERKLDGVVLGELLQLQMAEDLFDAVRWTEGAFRFESGAPTGKPSPAPPITPKDFLAGSLKHLERWAEIEAVIPDRAIAFRKKIDGPIPEQEVVRHRLTKEDQRLFSLVHPSRSVSSLLPLARYPIYQLYASLYLLARADLIEVAPAGAIAETPAPESAEASAFTQVRVRREGGRTFKESLIYYGVTALLLITVLALAVGTYLGQRSGEGEGATAAQTAPLREPRTAAQLERIRMAVETWRVRKGELPPSLDALVTAKLLEERDLRWPGYERSYVLLPDGDSFLIIRPKK